MGPIVKRMGRFLQRQIIYSPMARPLCWMGQHHRSKRHAYNDGKAMRTYCGRCGASLIKEPGGSWKAIPATAKAAPAKRKAKPRSR